MVKEAIALGVSISVSQKSKVDKVDYDLVMSGFSISDCSAVVEQVVVESSELIRGGLLAMLLVADVVVKADHTDGEDSVKVVTYHQKLLLVYSVSSIKSLVRLVKRLG